MSPTRGMFLLLTCMTIASHAGPLPRHANTTATYVSTSSPCFSRPQGGVTTASPEATTVSSTCSSCTTIDESSTTIVAHTDPSWYGEGAATTMSLNLPFLSPSTMLPAASSTSSYFKFEPKHKNATAHASKPAHHDASRTHAQSSHSTTTLTLLTTVYAHDQSSGSEPTSSADKSTRSREFHTQSTHHSRVHRPSRTDSAPAPPLNTAPSATHPNAHTGTFFRTLHYPHGTKSDTKPKTDGASRFQPSTTWENFSQGSATITSDPTPISTLYTTTSPTSSHHHHHEQSGIPKHPKFTATASPATVIISTQPSSSRPFGHHAHGSPSSTADHPAPTNQPSTPVNDPPSQTTLPMVVTPIVPPSSTSSSPPGITIVPIDPNVITVTVTTTDPGMTVTVARETATVSA